MEADVRSVPPDPDTASILLDIAVPCGEDPRTYLNTVDNQSHRESTHGGLKWSQKAVAIK